MSVKSAFITGGSRGIGYAVAKGLLEDGYSVALVARSEQGLKEAKNSLVAEHPNAKISIHALDVTDTTFVNSAFQDAVKTHGSISVVFNNAGIYGAGSTDLTSEDFKKIIDVNLTGAFNVAKAAIEHFRQQKAGYLMNLSSICGVHGFSGVGAYTASKFGMMGLNESLFRELIPEGIKVTAICPSWVRTDMTQHAPFPGTDMIQPEDMFKTVQYLLSLSAKACPREIVVECTSDIR